MGNVVNEAGTSGQNCANPVPLASRFKIGLAELVGICQDGGLHTSEMIEPLRYWLKWAEDATKMSDKQ